MPDPQGLLSAEEKQKVIKWLHDKWKGVVCPYSQDSNWIVGDHAVMPMVVGEGGATVIGGTSYPQVMVVCKTCGHTVFLNAVIVELFPAHQEAKNG